MGPLKKLKGLIIKTLKIRTVSVYQFSLILLLSTAFISVGLLTIIWIISVSKENNLRIIDLKENHLSVQKDKLSNEVNCCWSIVLSFELSLI